MKRRLIVIALLVAAGCTQNLTAPLNSVPITNITEYFWSAGKTELYDSDNITTRDSGAILLAADSVPGGKLRTTLLCHVSPDSITVERFGDGSIMDLSGGFEFVDSANGQLHSGGHVVLLRADPLADSSWRAGMLRLSAYPPFPIEARLLARLDTLSINGRSYPDVLAIRYAFEHPDLSADSIYVPYWVIFYARGHGPVMFDRVYTSSKPFERRALLP